MAMFHPDLSEDQRMIVDTVRTLTQDCVAPAADAIDREATIPDELSGQLAELGLLAVPLPEEAGGAGFDQLSYQLVLTELARGSAPVALHVMVQTTLFLEPLARSEPSARMREATEAVVGGAASGALALQEDVGTLELDALETRAEPASGGLVLTGRKTFVLGGPTARYALVIAMEEAGPSCFLVDLTAAGCARGEPVERLGMRGVGVCDLMLDGVAVTADHRVGAAGGAADVLAGLSPRAMLGVTALGCGLMRAASEHAARYAAERSQFGRAIAEFEAIRARLADAHAGYAVALNLLVSGARLLDAGRDAATLAESAKLVTSEAAMRATDDALQIFGGYGYSQEYPVERLYRDARYLALAFGGNEALRVKLAGRLLSGS